jgi:uncharacterized protein GlcG (DUF336 family)
LSAAGVPGKGDGIARTIDQEVLMRSKTLAAAILSGAMLAGPAAHADSTAAHFGLHLCKALPSAATVQADLQGAVTTVAGIPGGSGGLGNAMWATIVDSDGTVCLVVNTLGGGKNSIGSIWLGSRVISAQKANTANAFSLSAGSLAVAGGTLGATSIALSTANLYSAVQPGGSLYGLQASNPVDPAAAYAGPAALYAAGDKDPMAGARTGGVNVFGGGLALYDQNGNRVGAIGVSGDTSCTDHAVAWETRHALQLDYVPGGVSAAGDDNIVYDITPQAGQMPGISAGGFGHPHCLDAAKENTVLAALPAVRKPK